MAKASQNINKKTVEQKFTIKKLQENCMQLFGVSASTFVAATYKMTGQYTVEEMKKHIETWKSEAWKKKGVQ
jgi:hypothetical protein